MIKSIIISVFLFSNILFADGLNKKYYDIKHIPKMKQVFFSFINKMAKIENSYILEDRKYIKNYYNKNTAKMKAIRKRYGIKANSRLKDYLYIVDVIPNSMVLAQAAVESAWGKSRFFKDAKNVFGQWTWSGHGLIPKSRKKGSKHKIKIFQSYQKSLRTYLININKSWAYKKVRDLRAAQRAKNQRLSGSYLSAGLEKYSQKKQEYVTIIKKVIRHNNLSAYDIY